MRHARGLSTILGRPAVFVALTVSTFMINTSHAQNRVQRTDVQVTPGGFVQLPDDVTLLGAGASLGSGRFALLALREPGVVLVDLNGRLARRVGRSGAGPGEFRMPLTPFRVGRDTFAFFDAMLRRLSLFEASGRYLSSEQHPLVLPSGRVIAWLGNQRVLAWQYESLRSRGTPADSSYVYLLESGAGESARKPLIGFPKSPTMLRIVSPQATIATRQPFLWSPFFAYDHLKSQILVAYTSQPSAQSVSQIDLIVALSDGSFRSKTSLAVNARQVTDGERRRVADSIRVYLGLDTLGIRSSGDLLARQLYLPPHEPPLRGLFLDEAGGMWLWLREGGKAGDTICHWQPGAVVTHCGDLPVGSAPLATSASGGVLVVAYDSDDIPILSHLQLRLP